MCLMCEFYLAICDEPQCVTDAKLRAATDANAREEFFTNRSGKSSFLWKGYTDQPCTHIKAQHGTDCAVVKKTDSDYGLVFDTCSCELQADGTYIYY